MSGILSMTTARFLFGRRATKLALSLTSRLRQRREVLTAVVRRGDKCSALAVETARTRSYTSAFAGD
jgi:hypothetical protein